MASTYLTRSLSSTNTSWTFSAWVKKSAVSATNYLISWGNNGTDGTGIGFSSSDELFYYTEGIGSQIKTSAKYRDTNGFYHVVVKSNSNAITLYINGEEPTQAWSGGSNGAALDTSTMAIGKWVTSAYHHDGSMSHVHFIDGTAYDASAFGSTDATTGEWEAKTSPSVTYGTNGFFILKDGNGITDQSGEGNDFTLGGGTLTDLKDNPDNVFATLNPLHIQGNTNRSITYGNTRFYTTTAAWGSALSTLGFSSGKFYVEAKILALNSSTGYGSIAIQDINIFGSSGNTNGNLCENSGAGINTDYRSGQSAIRSDGSTVSSNVGDFSNNDIIGMAIDMDNKALYMHKNGTYYQIGGVTGVPTSGASKTGAITIPASVETCAIGLGSYTSNADSCYNFGNGYFGTTAITTNSGNGYAGAEGASKFNYTVPTGYSALSTKGLNE